MSAHAARTPPGWEPRPRGSWLLTGPWYWVLMVAVFVLTALVMSHL